MEDLITHANVLFQSNVSPPLPPAPAGEPVPAISYGSQHTRLTEVPPPLPPRSDSPSIRLGQHRSVPPSPTRQSQSNGTAVKANTTITSGSEDFAPQLPPRPTDSIHPSLRAGALSGQARQAPQFPARSAQFFDDDVSYAHIAPSLTYPVLEEQSSRPSHSLKRTSRVPPLPLPLVSPWSDGPSSATSAIPFPIVTPSAQPPSFVSPPLSPPDISPIDIDDTLAQDIIIPSQEDLQSGPSSGTSYASAISPVASVESSAGPPKSPVTPDMPSRPLLPGDSPNRTSVATIGPKSHVKEASSSSE